MADNKKAYFYGLGRRKTSTAQARLFAGGNGSITVNDQTINDYLSGSESLAHELIAPLRVLEITQKFNVSLKIRGGGLRGQVDAAKLAIANALADMDEGNRGTLKKAGLLKRDPREKERKKYGLKGARRAEQYTKR